MFRFLYFKKEKGFTMLEMIVVIFILVTAIVGAYSVFFHIKTSTSMLFSKLTAAYLTQEGIEIIRNIRDSNWLNRDIWNKGFAICNAGCEADYTTGTVNEKTPLRNYNGSFLKIDFVNGFYNYFSGSPTKFKRKITITPITPDILRIFVLVEWRDAGGKIYNFTAENNLYNWF